MFNARFPGGSLSRQAGRRFIGVFLGIGGILVLLGGLSWYYANVAFNQDQVERNRHSIQSKLEHRYLEWQRDADALAAHINYTHMLETPGSARWDKLRAYVNALGESFPFDTLAVADEAGHMLFRQGEESEELEFLAAPQHSDWYYSEQHQHAHRVLRTALWLGLQGRHGKLFLLKAIDNRLLIDLAGPGIELTITVDGVIRASSLGTRLYNETWSEIAGSPMLGVSQRDLPLAPPRILLHIRQTLPQAVSPTQFTLAGAALAAVLGLTLYLVIGAWLRRTVARVQALSIAADLFGKYHQMDPEIEAALDRAADTHDEVGALRTHLHKLMRASEARDEESRTYLQTLEILDEAVLELDCDGKLLRASPAWSRLIGAEELKGTIHDYFTGEGSEDLRQQLDQLFSGEKSQIALRLHSDTPQRDGACLECRFVPADNPVTRIRGVLRDVTQTYLQEKHISHMALHDALTGLPNRVLLEDRIKIALRMAAREKCRVGIGFIDLDHFKNINDALGHKAGDQLLIAFSTNFRRQLRNGDTLARWGGDEFVVLLPDMPGLDDIRHVSDKLVQASREPVHIEGHSLPVTFSMGFTIYPDDGENVETLLSQADQAMFYAKAQGRNMIQFYVDMTRKGLGRRELYVQSRLAAAINSGAIETWFQPLVDARSRRAIGLEALARWHDAELGWVSPAEFIPMAEALGLIGELGDLVLTHTLSMGRALMDSGHDLLLAVNISKRQLSLANCTERLLRDADTAGIAPGRIMLEITESVAMSEVDHADSRLRDLHEAGFKLAVDDFGVGYSSLSQLHEMPVDELKIDISFTRRARDPQGARLIQAIVGMAQALHLNIVAEGVEDGETAIILEKLGVHAFQGYHFAKPMPAADFKAWLSRH
jgi:diguanylate cyclase (GGDEF)-like protein